MVLYLAFVWISIVSTCRGRGVRISKERPQKHLPIALRLQSLARDRQLADGERSFGSFRSLAMKILSRAPALAFSPSLFGGTGSRLREGNQERLAARPRMRAEDISPGERKAGWLPNKFWNWKGHKVRYIAAGEENTGPSLLLVHGLFVNCDHWNNNMQPLADAGYRVYAIDLLGNGYSDKPNPYGDVSKGPTNGELSRTLELEEKHPLGSVYNFYTWSEQLIDFAEQVMRVDRFTLVANSIGTISALQTAIDRPDLVSGVVVVNPNFRELHVKEQPGFVQPITRAVQKVLRETPVGSAAFDAAANSDVVTQILRTPYYDESRVTEELVERLLPPLLLDGSKEVVFDLLSYSAGPLPEPQLSKTQVPVWVCYGEKDPWTPPERVERLSRFDAVKRVLALPEVGHCPHDESPAVVNSFVQDFVEKFSKVAAD